MLTKNLRRALLIPFVLLAGGCDRDRNGELPPGVADEGRPPRGMAWVIFNGDTVTAEVAATPEERQQGLMFRTELAEDGGMLFVFDREDIQSFWMQNTYIPLDIAHIDRRQVVVDIQRMEPETEEFYESAAPAMFALEVNEGWFAERGIEVGAQARIVMGRR
jgi:uncharacterized protein